MLDRRSGRGALRGDLHRQCADARRHAVEVTLAAARPAADRRPSCRGAVARAKQQATPAEPTGSSGLGDRLARRRGRARADPTRIRSARCSIAYAPTDRTTTPSFPEIAELLRAVRSRALDVARARAGTCSPPTQTAACPRRTSTRPSSPRAPAQRSIALTAAATRIVSEAAAARRRPDTSQSRPDAAGGGAAPASRLRRSRRVRRRIPH